MSRIEDLLEQLVMQNEEIKERLQDILEAVNEIRREGDWAHDGSSAGQVIKSLDNLQTTLDSIDINTAG